MRALTEEQQAAVDYRFDAPLAIVAGAGSGKTETLTRRVARAISSGARPEGVLVLTFSNKAARELRGRLAKHLGEAVAARVECATFHSFCLRLLRRFGREAGLGPDFSIFGDAAQRALVKLCCAAAGDDDDAAGDAAAPSSGSSGPWTSTTPSPPLVCSRDGPCRSWARGRFALGFVDEFQDTSELQLALLDGVFGLERTPLTVVGDDDQAIYSWRDAMGDAFGSFARRFPGATLLRLTRNYRSGATSSPRRGPSSRRTPPSTRRSDGAPDGSKLEILRVEGGPGAEARAAAREVAKLLDAGAKPRDVAVLCRSAAPALRCAENALTKLGVPCQIAGSNRFFERAPVAAALAHLRLVANELDDDACAKCLAEGCRGLGAKSVEALRRGGGPLLGACRTAAARGTLAPQQTAALWVLLARLDALYDAVASRAASASPVRSALRLLDDVLAPPVDGGDAKKRERRTARDLLEELRGVAGERERELEAAAPGLDALRHFLDTAMVAPDASEGVGDAVGTVTLCTIHKSKGLEWPHVLLLRATDGVFPARLRDAAGDAAAGSLNGSPSRLRRRDEAAHLEEERRLFHAAVSARAVGAEEDEFPRHRARAPGFAAAAPPPFAGFATAATIRDAVFDDDHAGAEDEAPPRPPPAKPGAGKITAFFKKAPKAAQGPEAGDVPEPEPAAEATRADAGGGGADARVGARRRQALPRWSRPSRRRNARLSRPSRRLSRPGPPSARAAGQAPAPPAQAPPAEAPPAEAPPPEAPRQPAVAAPSCVHGNGPGCALCAARRRRAGGGGDVRPRQRARLRSMRRCPRAARRRTRRRTSARDAEPAEKQPAKRPVAKARPAASSKAKRKFAAPRRVAPPSRRRAEPRRAFASPLLRTLSHLQGAMEKDAKPRKKRSKSPPKRPEGQKTIGSFFAKKPPPPPGDPSSQDDWF
ncbi:ATP-dependent DNA helicase [Aureococcus anophagefferens]|nr:ATP-dependent DNA helicase [Aureococcus anophagefferens]